MKNLFLAIFYAILKRFPHKDMPHPMPEVPEPPKPETPQAMVLRICKEENLTVLQTNDLYNTLRIESNFKNYRADGTPLIHENKVNGKLASTDWGICQINDYYHIGKGKDFPTVGYVLANPDKAVRFMAQMCKAGKLNLWVAYKSGAYKKNYVTVA